MKPTEKRETRDMFSFICPGCETPSFIHSPCSLCRLLMRSPPDTEQVVWLISDPEQRRTHPQPSLLSFFFFCIHTSLCLSISPLFQEPFSHLSTILTQIGGSNHKKIPRKKCWKTLTSSARAGKGGVKGVGVWRERYNPICYHLYVFPPLPCIVAAVVMKDLIFQGALDDNETLNEQTPSWNDINPHAGKIYRSLRSKSFTLHSTTSLGLFLCWHKVRRGWRGHHLTRKASVCFTVEGCLWVVSVAVWMEAWWQPIRHWTAGPHTLHSPAPTRHREWIIIIFLVFSIALNKKWKARESILEIMNT